MAASSFLNIDSQVDEQILSCLDLDTPKSFFLFAGAGSGKTRSLVTALTKVSEKSGQLLRLNRKKIAVITYTNAACDEIKHRIDYDPLFLVSTIHSFVWELIKNYQSDIREWLRTDIADEIASLEQAAATGRPGTKTALDREEKIQSKTKRLASLNDIKSFTYSPTGQNRTRDSLNHAEVIKMSADFLLNKPLMQEILICKFPILFIDESQDTKKELIEALFAIERQHKGKLTLGLFGDTMQRIYSDGKADLGINLPADWIKPVKKLNFRCPKRVITLINKVRSQADKQTQQPRDGQDEGFVRLFIVPNKVIDRTLLEEKIASQMADVTVDEAWRGPAADVKKLTLEHHMSARRMGFIELFEPLYQVDSVKTSLIDGSLSGLRYFTQLILPLVTAYAKGDHFTVARLIKQNSPLLHGHLLKESKEQPALLKKANDSVVELLKLWNDGQDPSLLEIVKIISQNGLFAIPEPLSIIARRELTGDITVEPVEPAAPEDNADEEETDILIDAWETVLKSPFSQIKHYDNYISNISPFGTHQGVKGLEFPRVMVILDDEEARGFLFSYEKLFGVKALSATDLNNIREGKDTTILRTLRLFYVACSRAEKSLAIVAYTENIPALKSHVLKEQWFSEDEIIILDTE